MKTDHAPLATVEQPAMSGTVDGWIPLVDEPPPLDWDLEDLFTPMRFSPRRRQAGRCGLQRRKEEDAAAAVGRRWAGG